MPAIVLYLATAAALIAAWRRFVQPVTLAASLALLLLPMCFSGRALLTGGVYAPIEMPYMSEPLQDYAKDHGITGVYNGTLSDLYMQMIPWQHTVRESLMRGQWPLWNPYMLCGSLLAANMQSAVYDPLNWLALLLPLPQALTYGAAMTFLLAVLFTFGFARSLGLRELPSLLAASAYAFSASLAFFVAWPLGRAWALLPLVLLGVRLVVRETNVRAAVVLTTSFVLLLVTGHPESALHICVLGAAWGLFELLAVRRWKAIGVAVLCGAIALLLTAILLLPFFSVMTHTHEHYFRQAYYAKIDLPVPLSVAGQRAMLSFFPWYGGQPERANVLKQWYPMTIRAGSIVFALALAALWIARRRDTWFFAGVALVCSLVGLDVWPLAHLLHEVPVFDIALNERFAFAAAFAFSILAAMAANGWGDAPRTTWIAPSVVLAALVAGTLLFARPQLAAGLKPALFVLLASAELIPLAAVVVLLFLRTPARTAVPLVFALLVVQRTIVDGSIYPSFPASAFYPTVPVLQRMQDDSSVFRMTGLHYAFLPDAAAMYGLEDARGYEAMTLRRMAETYPLWSMREGASFNNVWDKGRPFLSFLNVKYAIGSTREEPDEQWRLVLEDRNSRLFENTRVLPRAIVPRAVRYVATSPLPPADMQAEHDFAARAWLTVDEYPPHEIANGPGTLRIRRERVGTLDVEAVMENDGWVVVSEAAWPGWRAYVDDKRTRVHYANHAFLGVFVPKGTHRLRLVYQPEAFTRGRNITLMTIAGLIAYFALRRHAESRRRRSISAATTVAF
jgi:Bacterial membrane protein YfhO